MNNANSAKNYIPSSPRIVKMELKIVEEKQSSQLSHNSEDRDNSDSKE